MKTTLTMLFIVLSFCFVNQVMSMTCTKEVLGFTTHFRCPGIGDNVDKVYCCGSEDYRYCCTSEEFSAEINVVGLIVGILVSVVVVVIISVIICCCCCSCCLLAKRRQQGIILSNSPNTLGTSTTTTAVTYPVQSPYPVNQPQYPPSSGYPVYPPANTGYPPVNAGNPPPYPGIEQPAYNKGY